MSNNYSNKRSTCWNYMKYENEITKTHVLFPYIKTTSTSIKVCNAKLKLNGNSSVMSNHLLKIHGLNIKDVDSVQPRYDTAIPNQQVSIKQSLLNSAPYCESSLKYEHLLTATTDFIIKSGQPLSIVDDHHFIRLLAAFDNKFKLVPRQRLTNKILLEMIEKLKFNVKAQLEKIKFCHLTTDAWSSVASESYIGSTVHFIDPDLYLRSIQISLNHSPES